MPLRQPPSALPCIRPAPATSGAAARRTSSIRSHTVRHAKAQRMEPMSTKTPTTKTSTTLRESCHCVAPPDDAWQAIELLYPKLYEVVASGAVLRELATSMKSPRIIRGLRLSMTERLEAGAR